MGPNDIGRLGQGKVVTDLAINAFLGVRDFWEFVLGILAGISGGL